MLGTEIARDRSLDEYKTKPFTKILPKTTAYVDGSTTKWMYFFD